MLLTQRKLLLYTPLAHRASYRLEKAVATVIPEKVTEVVHTHKDLAQRLRRPHDGLEVAVILATGQEDLRELWSLEQMLENLRIILILPDAAPRTIALGHSLRPRYVTDIHSDFQDVAAVLRKLLKVSRFPSPRIVHPPGFNQEN